MQNSAAQPYADLRHECDLPVVRQEVPSDEPLQSNHLVGLTAQQMLAVTCSAREVFVCAGAGSGKTHVLVERYIEVLRRASHLSVSGLIAVTFTRKAANEMRTRLKARLHQLVEQTAGDERVRWQACLSQIDAAKIGTIHALCESIIKAFPVEAGIDPQFEVLEDVAQAELLNVCVDQALREAITEDSEEHALFLDFDLRETRRLLVAAVKSGLQFRESVHKIESSDQIEFCAHAEAVMSYVRMRTVASIRSHPEWLSALQYLSEHPWPTQGHVLEEKRRTALQLASLLEAVRISPACEQETENAYDAGSTLGSAWNALQGIAELKPHTSGGNKEEAKALRSALRVLRKMAEHALNRVPDLNEEDERGFVAARAFARLSGRVERHYQAGKRAALRVDYNDLIAYALRALEQPSSAARKHYNDLIHEILIDEFQDTNKVQSRLIRLLAGASTTLFLIGDDKQSIYKFQGADILAFAEWRERVSSGENASLLPLNRSFRSHPSVVEFINTFFSILMGESNSPYDARFERLFAARGVDSEATPRVKVIQFTPLSDDESRPDVRRQEAQLVAATVGDTIARGMKISDKSGSERSAQYGDLAVLVQRNRDFASIEAAFTESGIPYITYGGKGFLERQEIFDIENLLRFVDEPLNDHALVGVLRSPMFSVGDDVLHLIGTARRKKTSLWQALNLVAQSRLPGLELLRSVAIQLRRLIDTASRTPVASFLRQVIQSTCYDLTLLALPHGKQRSRNLWKLVELAARQDDLTAGEFANSLQLMRQLGVKQSDAPLAGQDAVKIMTVHASKGLEFPIVLLPVLDASATKQKARLIYNREYGIAFNTARTDDAAKPAWFQTAAAIETEMEIAEKKRLFYVAATRARDYLMLFLNTAARRSDSFATWLRQQVGEDEGSNDGSEPQRSSWTLRQQITIANAEAELFSNERKSNESEPLWQSRYDLMWREEQEPPSVVHLDWAKRVTADENESNLDQRKIGTFFHALLEYLPADGSAISDQFLECIAQAQGAYADTALHGRLLVEGKRMLDLYFSSELHARLKGSKRFHELPYFSGSDDFRLKRPDLLFVDEAGNWHVVDFKTDQVDEYNFPAHINKHRQQLTEYAEDVRRILGVECSQWIYFARAGILQQV